MTKISNAADLRSAYMEAFDSFSIHFTDLAARKNGFNSRYARELLATLTHAGLLTKDFDSDGGDMWQVINPGTYDNHTREEAEAVIDAFLNQGEPAMSKKTAAPAKKAVASKEKTFHPCNCGCKENVPSTSFYRPGHDARHAGAVAREIAANYTTKGFDRRTLLKALPSDALRDKAEKIAEKATARLDAKMQKEADKANKPAKVSKPEPEPESTPEPTGPKVEDGLVTVNKTEQIARRKDGVVQYLNKSGGWSKASKAASATFVEC